MATLDFEIDAIATYAVDAPILEIYSDGVLVEQFLVTASSDTYSLSIDYSDINSLNIEFRFADAHDEASRSVEIEEVRANGNIVPAVFYGSQSTLNFDDSASISSLNSSYEAMGSNYGLNRIVGTSGRDNLTGSAGRDKFDASADRNTIDGGDGDDMVDYSNATSAVRVSLDAATPFSANGFGNNDILTSIEDIRGSQFNDRIYGDDVDNDFYGNDGSDVIFGRGGNDQIHGGAGNDSIRGEAGNDFLFGGDGNDILVAGSGVDYLDGGDGADTANFEYVTGASQGVTVDLSALSNQISNNGLGETGTLVNIERVVGSSFADTITASNSAQVIEAGGGADIIYGGNGQDRAFGQDGNDTFHTSLGRDSFYGGNGTDTVDYSSASGGIIVYFNGANHFTNDGDGNNDFVYDVENIIGSNYDDRFYGSTVAEEFTGNDGNDLFYGGGGDDTLTGGDGDDTFYGEDGSDTISGGAGNDTVVASIGADIVDGGADFDSLNFVNAGVTEGVNINMLTGNVTNNGFGESGGSYTGFERVLLGGGADTIVMGNGQNYVYGGNGHDVITGGSDIDYLYGEGGNDTFYSSYGTDFFDGGTGLDAARYDNELAGVRVIFNDANNRVVLNNGVDYLTSIEIVHGSDFNDQMYGSSGSERFYGNAGTDVIKAGGGNDIIYGGDDRDSLWGEGGTDTIYGEGGDDVFVGSEGNDSYYGGTGYDTLNFSIPLTANGLNIDMSSGQILDNGWGGTGNISEIERISATNFADTITMSDADSAVQAAGGADNITSGAGDDMLHGHGITQSSIISAIQANSGLKYNGTTNTFYSYVTGAQTYANAVLDAQSTTVNGVAGNLVNITSQVENEFLQTFVTGNAWIGGVDLNDDGVWSYDDGVEEGVAYTLDDGSGDAFGAFYTNFGLGEGNSTNQNNLMFNAVDGTWMDSSANNSAGYVIEWNLGDMNPEAVTDILTSNGGNDYLYGADGDDQLNGGAGDDLLYGGNGNDTLNGGADNDVISGGDGDDTIDGGAGDDVIYDGTGLDIMTGGSGTDMYIFEEQAATNDVDQILDFNASEDILNVTELSASAGATITAANITNYFDFASYGGNSYLEFNSKGKGNSHKSFVQLAGVTGLDVVDMFNSGNIIA